jgi:hypothetical protein
LRGETGDLASQTSAIQIGFGDALYSSNLLVLLASSSWNAISRDPFEFDAQDEDAVQLEDDFTNQPSVMQVAFGEALYALDFLALLSSSSFNDISCDPFEFDVEDEDAIELEDIYYSPASEDHTAIGDGDAFIFNTSDFVAVDPEQSNPDSRLAFVDEDDITVGTFNYSSVPFDAANDSSSADGGSFLPPSPSSLAFVAVTQDPFDFYLDVQAPIVSFANKSPHVQSSYAHNVDDIHGDLATPRNTVEATFYRSNLFVPPALSFYGVPSHLSDNADDQDESTTCSDHEHQADEHSRDLSRNTVRLLPPATDDDPFRTPVIDTSTETTSSFGPATDAVLFSSRFPEGYRLIPEFAEHYVLGDELGAGANGFVISAHHLHRDQQFAVKFMAKDRIPLDAWQDHQKYGRLPMEIMVPLIIRHENVIRCREVFEDEVYFYIVSHLSFLCASVTHQLTWRVADSGFAWRYMGA